LRDFLSLERSHSNGKRASAAGSGVAMSYSKCPVIEIRSDFSCLQLGFGWRVDDRF
jgi:hypothetical protein